MYSFRYTSERYKWQYTLPHTMPETASQTDIACNSCRFIGKIQSPPATPVTKVIKMLRKEGWTLRDDGTGAICFECYESQKLLKAC